MRIHLPSGSAGLILLSILAVFPPNASANSLAIASATLDWNALTISLTGNLTLDEFLYQASAGSSVSTDLFGYPHSRATSSQVKSVLQGVGPQDWSFTAASLQESGIAGYADALALTSDGFLASSAETAWFDPEVLASHGNENSAEAETATNIFSYAVSGSGSGTVSISIPYTLSVSCSASEFDTSGAFAQVVFYAPSFPPNFGIVDNPTLICNQPGMNTLSGTMTVSENYTFEGPFPYTPGVIQLTTTTEVTAGSTLVSEPSTAVLFFVAGLTSLAGMGLRRIRS